MSVYSIYDARNNFSSLVKTAEEGEAVELTRHNKTVAVLLGADEYKHLQPSQSFFINSLNKWRSKWNVSQLDPLHIADALESIECGKNRETADMQKIDEIWK